jgi:hypothetical protein
VKEFNTVIFVIMYFYALRIFKEIPSPPGVRQDSSREEDFDLFPGETEPASNEQRRETVRTQHKDSKFYSNSKYSHKLRDLMDDNIT